MNDQQKTELDTKIQAFITDLRSRVNILLDKGETMDRAITKSWVAIGGECYDEMVREMKGGRDGLLEIRD